MNKKKIGFFDRCNKYGLFIYTAIVLLSIAFIILAFAKYFLHSDCAGLLFWAEESFKQGRLYPKNFHYTTVVFGPFYNFFLIFAMFFTKNEYLIHSSGSVMAVVVLVLGFFILEWDNKKKACIESILFLIPFGGIYNDMLFYQSAYVYNIWAITIYLICFKILLNMEGKTVSSRRKGIVYALYLFIFIWICASGLSNVLQIIIPSFFAIFVLFFLRKEWDFKAWLKEKYLIKLIVWTFIGTIVGLIGYKVICAITGFNNVMFNIGILDPVEISNHFFIVFGKMWQLLGVEATTKLFDLVSISNCIVMVFAVIINFVIPIVMMKRLKEIESPYIQYLVVFTQTSNVLTMFMMIFCGYAEARYLIPMYMMNIILCAAYIYEFHFQEYKPWKNIVLAGILITSFTLNAKYYFAMDYHKFLNGNTMKTLFHPHTEDKVVKKVFEELEHRDVHYGFAPFWRSFSYMMASNSRIGFAAYDATKPTVPYYFDKNDISNVQYYGVSSDLYKPELHTGKCFVMIEPGKQLADAYYQLAIDSFEVEGMKFLIFDHNIYEYPLLRAADGTENLVIQ